MSITKNQIKIIHTLKNAIGISEEGYRDILQMCNVKSSKELSFEVAKEIIDRLEKYAIKIGVWDESRKKKRFDKLGRRPGMASPAQLRLIQTLWSNVSRAPDNASQAKALNHFLERKFIISRIEWLTAEVAGKVIKTLMAMNKQRQLQEA